MYEFNLCISCLQFSVQSWIAAKQNPIQPKIWGILGKEGASHKQVIKRENLIFKVDYINTCGFTVNLYIGIRDHKTVS